MSNDIQTYLKATLGDKYDPEVEYGLVAPQKAPAHAAKGEIQVLNEFLWDGDRFVVFAKPKPVPVPKAEAKAEEPLPKARRASPKGKGEGATTAPTTTPTPTTPDPLPPKADIPRTAPRMPSNRNPFSRPRRGNK